MIRFMLMAIEAKQNSVIKFNSDGFMSVWSIKVEDFIIIF